MRPVWIIDDDRSIRWVFEKTLAKEDIPFKTFSSAQDALSALPSGAPQVVVSDIRMPGGSGLELLQSLKERHPHLPVIIMTAYSDLESAVAAFQGGAFEYLPKPFDVDHAVDLIRRAMEESLRQNDEAEVAEASPEILGQAGSMQEVFRAIGRLTQSHATVLINGESGTGKELVARALHRHSPRASKPFIAINTAAIPKELLESELFGHERGAFTGAQNMRRGRFEQAEGGTLFLDEIGDMPLEAQTRLLRVLQQGEFVPVGGHHPVRTNVRIVAASHRDLRLMVSQGLFREDLFYRLNVVPLRLPPLRERVDDIPALVQHFLVKVQSDGLPLKTLTPEAMVRLKAQSWPGNVRELENLVRRLAVLYAEDTIGENVITLELEQARASSPGGDSAPADDSLGQAIERHIERYFRAHDGALPPSGVYDRLLREVERPLIARALAATRGNQLKAADVLGLNRNTLRKKIRELDIHLSRAP